MSASTTELNMLALAEAFCDAAMQKGYTVTFVRDRWVGVVRAALDAGAVVNEPPALDGDA